MAIEDVEKEGQRLVGKMLEDLRKEKPAQPKTVFAAVLVSLSIGEDTERRCLAAEVDDGDGEMQRYIEEFARDAQPFLEIGERVIVERFSHVFVHGDDRAFVRAYMQRVCVCGVPRSEHAHFMNQRNDELHILAVNNVKCAGFLDAIELKLKGNPAGNPLLQDLLPPLAVVELTDER